MTRKELYQILKSIGLPIAYYQFKEGDKDNPVPSLPYMVYYYPSRTDESADGINFAKVYTLNIELYTKEKDFDTEDKVESTLTDADIYYTKSESYLNDEQMYEVLYEGEVILNG